jgi:fatty acid desaturase
MSRLGWIASLLLVAAALFFAVVAATSRGPLGGLPYLYSGMALVLATFVVAVSTLRASRRKVREAERKLQSHQPSDAR